MTNCLSKVSITVYTILSRNTEKLIEILSNVVDFIPGNDKKVSADND